MAKQEDWWPGGRAALLVVLGLATGTAVVQRSPAGTGGALAPASSSSPRATRAISHASATALAGSQPVVSLLAEAVGVDLEGTRARDAVTAWRDYLCLKMRRGPNAAEASLVAALDVALQDLGGSPHIDDHSGNGTLKPLPLAGAIALLRAHSTFEDGAADVKQHRTMALEYLDGIRHETTIERVEAAAAKRGTELDVLIAMLPDYVDSQTRRLFDSGLGGIQQAAGAFDYSLDRFYLPDLSDTDTGSSDETPAHQSGPGALLFRTVYETEKGPFRERLLLVLVVTEMPTLGVHRNALLSSVALIDAWQAATVKRHSREGAASKPGANDAAATKPSLRVLGPFFSGSVSSLKEVLESISEDPAKAGRRKVEIVTGSATDPTIGARLRSVAFGGEKVAFHAIVPDNLAVNAKLIDYLGSLNPKWRCGRGVAMLVEGNTKFGLSLGSLNRTDDCFRPLRVTFPLHVSRLRGATDADMPALSLLPPPAVRLKLSESAQARDLIPAMTPEITAAVVDSALDNLLSALKRERYTAIGIFATDARDHLFLARRIARIVPDVLMFGTQSDLLYVNPDYAPFLRGTLIASSYPVFNETQLLMGQTAGARRQFTTASEQGTYNASLSLIASLRAPPRSSASAGGEQPPSPDHRILTSRLVDARPFDTDCFAGGTKCSPAPVWLSVIGSSAIWPISSNDSERERPEHAGFRATVAPPMAIVAGIGVLMIAIAHPIGMYLISQHRHRRYKRRRTHAQRTSLTSLTTQLKEGIADRCDWHESRLLWNLYRPSHVGDRSHTRGRITAGSDRGES